LTHDSYQMEERLTEMTNDGLTCKQH